ncbi:hypothetical protein [Stenotrophomonas phage BUCT627]|uniref:Uncharacterized protein n=2 Tax=Bixiavirus TaxID=3044676 RepID=A0AC61NQN6_9CAUD|nr:hypothetical protein PQD76_gp53 [Stenotrophomonas phage BUCT626]YP_010677443.1 hypothetical protein PQD77_gp037 [Stenotrophomonas phage BUCT627]QYC96643.1 hypothetical protein [Stenotrophomonas phage BUCT627]QYC96757.1 hypothetical protein [Stenotrophomonas phage BUCT626]
MSDLIHAHVTSTQSAIIEKFTEGFDSPSDKVIWFTPPGMGKSAVMEDLRRKFLNGESTNGKVVTHIGWDEAAPITAEQIREWWDAMKEQPDAVIVIDSIPHVLDLKRQLMKDTIENELRSFLPTMIDECKAQLFPEKPWIEMNDWRKNRGGKRNR